MIEQNAHFGYDFGPPGVLGNTTCAPRNDVEATEHKYRPVQQYKQVGECTAGGVVR